MIHWYRFKNFYSFKNETKVNFMLKKNSSRSDLDAMIGSTGVSKVSAVMGANGSGKSNLLKPLAFIRWFTNNSFKELDSTDELPSQTHATNMSEPTEIEILFDIFFYEKDDFCKCLYTCKFDKDKVLHERLKIKLDDGWHTFFNRRLNRNKKSYIVSSFQIKSDNADISSATYDCDELKNVPFNASAISYFSRKEHAISRLIADELREIYTNIGSAGKQHFSYSNVMRTTKFFKDNEDAFNIAKKFMKRMDFGLDDIILKEQTVHNPETEKTTSQFMPFGIHSNNGASYEIPFYLESSGTQACYHFISNLICAFKTGGIAVIDELDSDLHPLMVNEIIDMFSNKDINPKNAQLIFSCHSPEVLKILKKHNVYLVEKYDGESICWRLDEMTGLRSQDNLYNKYITGALGAVPDISL